MLNLKLIAFNMQALKDGAVPTIEDLLTRARDGQSIEFGEVRQAGVAIAEPTLKAIITAGELTKLLHSILYSSVTPVYVLDQSNGGHSNEGIPCIAWQPEGNLLASAGLDGYLKLTDVSERRVVQSHDLRAWKGSELEHRGLISVKWSPCGKFLVTENETYNIPPEIDPGKIVDTQTQTVIADGFETSVESAISTTARFPDTFLKVTTYSDGRIEVKTTAGQALFTLGDENRWGERVTSHRSSPDKNYALFRTRPRNEDPYVAVVALTDNRGELWKFDSPYDNWINKLLWSPTSTWAAMITERNTISLWNVEAGIASRFEGEEMEGADPDKKINTASWHRDGKYLAIAIGNTIKLIDVEQPKTVYTLHQDNGGHRARVKSIAFSPDGELLASSDRNGKINVYAFSDILEAIKLEAGDTGND
ncbi:MAG: hypothetical protein HQ596_01895 [Candidatus Saganbacteria bacterium]|nr:hypothetical protein [Candidatus Saganbacteria bacterium]